MRRPCPQRGAARHLPIASLVLGASLLAVGSSVPARAATEGSDRAAGPSRPESNARREFTSLLVHPASLSLRFHGARHQVLVSGEVDPRRPELRVDLTRRAAFVSEDPGIASVSSSGVVEARATGRTEIRASVGDLQVTIPVQVEKGEFREPLTLEEDILPVLTRHGCNSGPCHGKARGQNGFQLSLLGFNPDFDYESLVQEGRGRRVAPGDADASLLLAKPAGRIAHGGGERLQEGERPYATLRRWIESGFPRRSEDDRRLEGISVWPAERTLVHDEAQQLQVTAHYSDGSQEDVTSLATFQSSESPIVQVDANGLLRAGPIPGEAGIMARYRGQIALCRASIPLPGDVPDSFYASLPRYNFIDDLVWKKLSLLELTPSQPAPASTLLRRVHVDIIGRLPDVEETRAFLEDSRPGKYERLVDRLLERPEYADHWANKWADLLRPNPYRVGIKAVWNLDAWLRDVFRRNLPHDEFVRELLTAQGSTFRHGATVIFRDRRSPDELVTLVSQLFLGIRLECAKCHHHPFEVWSQKDFYSLAAFFARVGRKGTGLSPPISGGEEIVYVADRGVVRHPLSGEVLPPRPLFGEVDEIGAEDDPRRELAEWMVRSKENYFARVQVNRVWADLMGRGLVEPVDDLRASNPPSNEALLDALAEHFRRSGYDNKELLRTIVLSYVYGLSSTPTGRNVADTRNYSRHYRQRLRAEVLLDATSDITGVRDRFAAMPDNSRAMELWTHRSSSVFLDTFGRPDPNKDPPCERLGETSVTQALHLLNAPALHAKVTADTGRAARLATSPISASEAVRELYLATYCRYPDAQELAACLELFPDGSRTASASDDATAGHAGAVASWSPEAARQRRQALEDILWALLNTPEFVFKD